MNVQALVALLFLGSTLVSQLVKSDTLKIALVSLAIVVSAVPVVYGFYEFFTSPKSRWLRIKFAVHKMVFSEKSEEYHYLNKQAGKGIYCNPFSVDSQVCKHRYLVQFNGAKRKVESGLNFDSQTWNNEMLMLKLNSREDQYQALEVISRDDPTITNAGDKEGYNVGYLNKHQLLFVIMSIRCVYCIEYRINFPNLSLQLTFNAEHEVSEVVLNYDRIGLPIRRNGTCSLSNFVNMVDVFLFCKLRDRTCCFIVKNSRKIRSGFRLHCETIFEAFDQLRTGFNVDYSAEVVGFKCVEGY